MPGVWEEMTNEQRVSSVHFDFMRHNEMALFAGVLMMGKVQFKPVGTAATDGLDVYYDPTFWRGLTREEARFTVGHEVSHKALKHCTHYKEACEKFPQLSNIAMDYVVNGLLHQADPGWKWMSPPKSIKIYIDPKYYNWSFPRVLMDLVNKQKEGSMEGGCAPFDQHMPGEQSAEATQKTAKEIEEALRQGQIIAKANRSRSNKGSGGALAVESFIESKTNWTQYLRDFVTTALRGTDVARWSRINTRMFAATGGQVALPTLYNETTGHVGIFADTSASMARTYPLLFGEVAHIMKSVKPEKVTLLWWDTKVARAQEFLPDQYDSIRTQLKPAGGGGTSPQCVADYIEDKDLQFQCCIWLTDGLIGKEPVGMRCPQLWGVVNNPDFVARSGQTIHISTI